MLLLTFVLPIVLASLNSAHLQIYILRLSKLLLVKHRMLSLYLCMFVSSSAWKILLVYFSEWVHDAVKICSEVRIEGLETLDYFDNLMHRERFIVQGDAITFDCEVQTF